MTTDHKTQVADEHDVSAWSNDESSTRSAEQSAEYDDPADSLGLSAMFPPSLTGFAHDVGRDRVFEALFHVPAQTQTHQLGRYAVLSPLGRGGMGTVLEAFDRTLDRKVAVKILHEELDAEHTARLLREAQALAKLSHPNVVQVYEADTVDGRTFVAMELVKGQTLEQWMHQDPPPDWRACVRTFIQAGEGLAAAHAKGLVHRDFKPSNAILDEEERPRVLDFGLARWATVDRVSTDEPEHEHENDRDDAGLREDTEREQTPRPTAHTPGEDEPTRDVPLTRTGAVLGTPAYMPPEQLQGQEADARSDQFSFCVSLWEAVYGQRPFKDTATTLDALGPPAPGSPVPTTLRKILERGLAADPEQRWPSMEELLAELHKLVAPRSARWIAAGLVVGLLGLGAAVGMPQYLEMQERCTGALAQMTGIWDDERRQQVEDAILGTELSYAPETWERVQPRLDDYAQAWVDKHTEVCEATAVRREQTDEAMRLRMTCLGRRRTSLRAMVDVLTQADAQMVNKAVELAAGLPALRTCDDIDWLEQYDQRVPPPEDAQVAQQVEDLREELADARAILNAGSSLSALPQTETLVGRASALSYPPVLAEAEFVHGKVLELNGKYKEAEQALQEAHARGLRHGHDSVVLAATQALTSMVGYIRERPAEGQVWGRAAVALAEYTGEDTELARSLEKIGLLHSQRGDIDEARRHFLRVLELRQGALEADHPDIAISLTHLGNTNSQLGHYDEGAQYFERALQVQRKVLGANHPNLAGTLDNLGILYRIRGTYDESKRHHQRALEIREETLGADHPMVAKTLTNLATTLENLGERDEAIRLYHRALRMKKESLGSDHPSIALVLTNLAVAHHHLNQFEEARRYNQQALKINEKALGPDHIRVAGTLNNLGIAYQGLGDHDEARRHFERALRIYEKKQGPNHPSLGHSLVGLARTALKTDDPESARKYAQRALSIREAAKEAPKDIAEARFVLARALWSDPNERTRARMLTEQARETFAELGKSQSINLAAAEEWLAEHPVQP